MSIYQVGYVTHGVYFERIKEKKVYRMLFNKVKELEKPKLIREFGKYRAMTVGKYAYPVDNSDNPKMIKLPSVEFGGGKGTSLKYSQIVGNEAFNFNLCESKYEAMRDYIKIVDTNMWPFEHFPKDMNEKYNDIIQNHPEIFV